MATVVIAPDGFGGTLTAVEAAEAIAAGWRAVRPDDRLRLLPMSDGGEGLLDVLERPEDTRHHIEVAGPLGHPVWAAFLQRPDGSTVVESALACGPALVPSGRRAPLSATTYGVGQLLEAARLLDSPRILVGLGGSASVDGGAGALTALGFRPTIADGSGLKIGGGELVRVAAMTTGWAADWSGVEVEVLADVTTPLTEAASVLGPRAGASPEDVGQLRRGLARWAEVVERDLPVAPPDGRHRLRELPGSGAAGGLGYALVAALGARLHRGSAAVAELVGLPAAIATADLVVTGGGRLDATTTAGRVVPHVAGSARARGLQVRAVVGQVGPGAPALDDVQIASPGGPPDDPAAALRRAAGRSASVWAP